MAGRVFGHGFAAPVAKGKGGFVVLFGRTHSTAQATVALDKYITCCGWLIWFLLHPVGTMRMGKQAHGVVQFGGIVGRSVEMGKVSYQATGKGCARIGKA